MSSHHVGCMLLLMTLFIVTSVARPTSTPSSRKRRPSTMEPLPRQQRHRTRHTKEPVERWLNPCAGSDAVLTFDTVDATEDTSSQIELDVDSVSPLADRIDALIREIDTLKKHYADHRFKESVQVLDQLGFQLDGLPKIIKKIRPSTGAHRLRDVLVQAVSDLSVVAPLLESALDGERQFEHSHHYVDKYEQLIDNPRHGFYSVLCELTRLTSNVNDARRTSSHNGGTVVVNNAIRHFRDYVVLRDLRKLLHRLRTELRQPTR